MHTIFRNPWTLISLLGSILLLALTALRHSLRYVLESRHNLFHELSLFLNMQMKTNSNINSLDGLPHDLHAVSQWLMVIIHMAAKSCD